MKQRLDGSCELRVVARGFGQTVSPDAGNTTLRGLLTVIHRNAVVEPVPEAQVDSFTIWRSQDFATCLEHSQHKENQRHGL